MASRNAGILYATRAPQVTDWLSARRKFRWPALRGPRHANIPWDATLSGPVAERRARPLATSAARNVPNAGCEAETAVARLPRMPAGQAVFFLSDAHLGARPAEEEAARRARLHAFLTSLPGRASELYVVGDLFDFWFEYRSAIPRRHFDTLAVLRQVVLSGVAVTYLN